MAGNVILVGAGPGDVGLLTLRGREAIAAAQVVLFDRLVGEDILSLIPESATRIDVGKSSGRHLIPQEEINRLILEHAEQGKRVVRLKGGDSYLFGRGAEELEAVAARGIPYEVVPGVTSAISVPSYGGIPVTHREWASSVHIITGHPRKGAEPDIRYQNLVNLGGTLLFLMGLKALPQLTAGLLAAGMDSETPAALIQDGTRPSQRKLVSTVSDIAKQAAEQGFAPPSILLVGEVCRLDLDWFTRRPLHGARVVVTRPQASAGTLTGKLRQLGADVMEYPCITTAPLPEEGGVLDTLASYHWIVFTSAVGVAQFFRQLDGRGLDARALSGAKLAVVGSRTGEELVRHGLRADYQPLVYDAKHLAAGLAERVRPGDQVLLYRAKGGAPELATTLTAAGCQVRDAAVYQTLYQSPHSDRVRDALAKGAVNWVTFTSASTVKGFVQSLPGVDFAMVRGVCIGEETAAAARAEGIQVVVSPTATMDSIVDTIAALWAAKGAEQ